jgi:DNA topoisomerase
LRVLTKTAKGAAGERAVERIGRLLAREILITSSPLLPYPFTTPSTPSHTTAQLPIVLNKEIAQSVMTWLTSEDDPLHFTVSTVTDKKASRKSPAPFITSTLQQECSRRLGMNPSRCMSVAQELYEEGTYTLRL